MSFKNKYISLLSSLLFLAVSLGPILGEAEAIIWRHHTRLLPTQFTVGRLEIEIKKAEIAQMSRRELAEYRRKNKITVVIAPNGQYYVVDGHHTAIALIESGITNLAVKVKKDYSQANMSMAKFERKMIAKDRVYLSEYGVEKSFDELPVEFKELKDDPFRSLAWVLRRMKVFKNLKLPFQEFYWAEYFRKYLSPEDYNTKAKLLQNVPQVIDFLREDRPAYLPGYKHHIKKKSADECKGLLSEKYPASF